MSKFVRVYDTYEVLTKRYHHRLNIQFDLTEGSINRIAEAVVSKLDKSVRHGRWIYNEKPMLGNAYGSYYCSECGAFHPHRERYCPNCGADMREVENDKIN